MAANDYVSVTLWRVPGNVDRAYRVLVDIENYPRWWLEVYLRVEPLTPLRKTIGDKVRLLTRGKLPYKIRWQSEIVQANPPHGFIIRDRRFRRPRHLVTQTTRQRSCADIRLAIARPKTAHSKFVMAFQGALSLEPSLGHGSGRGGT